MQIHCVCPYLQAENLEVRKGLTQNQSFTPTGLENCQVHSPQALHCGVMWGSKSVEELGSEMWPVFSCTAHARYMEIRLDSTPESLKCAFKKANNPLGRWNHV